MWKMEEVPIFVAKKVTLEDFSSDFAMQGILCHSIHGNREEANEDLKTDVVRILIAPDVACRGIDMKVTHSIPYVFLSLASVSKGYIFYVFHIYIIIISSFMFVFSLAGCGLFLRQYKKMMWKMEEVPVLVAKKVTAEDQTGTKIPAPHFLKQMDLKFFQFYLKLIW